MSQSPSKPQEKTNDEAPLSLWKAIVLIIVLVFGIVSLFGVLIYLFARGVQQMGLPIIANIAIFVIISGIFAWLLKRLTDIISGLSHLWFPEELNDKEQ
jgi:CBS domain containing-hemolysin-like protein